MDEADRDMLMRMAAFGHVRRLGEIHDHLTATELKPGFIFEGERIPLINPQQGIFKPQQMRFLLSIKTVYPKPGGKVWYDDQRAVHRQIFDGDETVDYAFMGQDPEAADNRWLREAFENQVPIIYFLGIAPGTPRRGYLDSKRRTGLLRCPPGGCRWEIGGWPNREKPHGIAEQQRRL
jgi:putative restriction endonuclease